MTGDHRHVGLVLGFLVLAMAMGLLCGAGILMWCVVASMMDS
jgi:hypothetical protein